MGMLAANLPLLVTCLFASGQAAGSSGLGGEFISVEGTEVSRGGCSTAVFVKPFTNSVEVKSATWTVTSLGVMRVYVNGHEVGGDDFLKPGFTHPKKRRSSFEYDVTSLVARGAGERNVLCAEVTPSWWRDAVIGRSGKFSAFRGVLKVVYADGKSAEIPSDTSWLAQYAGPVRHATIWGGEKYDARIGTPWRTSGGEGWRRARVNKEFNGAITPLEGRSVKVRRDLSLAPKAVWVWKGADGASKDRHGRARVLRRYADGERFALDRGETLVLDFGQNCAGVPEFTAKAASGVELKGRPAEILNDANGEKSRGNDGPAGSCYLANYRTAGSAMLYTFAGKGEETWHPAFTFFGGRYWSFTANGRVELSKVRQLPVMSIAAEDETGTIETGEKDVNKLISNCVWGMRSNYLSIPTDCPQRNERWGWAGDTQVFVGAAVYAADVCGFLAKWMTDMRDSQMTKGDPHPGSFRIVAPAFGKGFRGHNIGWSDAGVIVPWTLWKNYGDTKVVEDNWKAMCDFMALLRRTGYKTAAKERQTADWLSMEKYEAWRRGWGSKFAKNPFWPGETDEDMRAYWNFLGACYRIWDLRMMSEMAAATGRGEEASAFSREADEAVATFRKENLASDGLLPEKFRDMQTPALFALRLGLLPTEAAVKKTADTLRSSLKAGGYAAKTGFLGTPILLDTLCDELDDPALAYSVLLQHGCPGWLYSVDQGATTIWERWDGYTKERGFGPVAMNSFNHYAYGAVMGWMYRTMAGIRPGPKGGYRHFILAPRPDPRVGHCTASYRNQYGTVRSAWKFENGACRWSFTIPAGTTATVTWDGVTREYSAGDYTL